MTVLIENGNEKVQRIVSAETQREKNGAEFTCDGRTFLVFIYSIGFEKTIDSSRFPILDLSACVHHLSCAYRFQTDRWKPHLVKHPAFRFVHHSMHLLSERHRENNMQSAMVHIYLLYL